MPKSKGGSQVMVPGQWLITTHEWRKVYVPNPNKERGNKCGIWTQPKWQDHLYMNYW